MNDNAPGLSPNSPRVFIAEYLSGGGMFDTPPHAIPDSLLGEGSSMWRAMVEDFSRWAHVRTPVDPRLKFPKFDTPNIEVVAMETCPAPWSQWISVASGCDFAVVIIPENDGLLTKGISLMRAAGIEVLAPNGNAIGLTGDKWATAKWLHKEDIAHPVTWCIERRTKSTQERPYVCSRPLSAGKTSPLFSDFPEGGYIVKPRDGCGAMDVRRYNELEPALASMQEREITQQRLVGRSASVVLTGHRTSGKVNMLPAVWQTIEDVPREIGDDGHATSQLVYRGGCGPVPAEMQLRAQALVSRVIQALPGKFSGFVGIDLILGKNANHDAVIEINSRLTTSYIGLRRMTDQNLTRLVFDVSEKVPTISVPTESVQWCVGECATALPGCRS
ncbi:ATP-grasp domain-containing protein [Aporhodopirellula aestuarii]|uniref:ATP-grasp domain-containing protein n=1 Tax=Aporhodopirellula aestuarii TaxID=2950107 RepID=A0ABT0U659_9BACT|nr:ATP-grasp domain-containing protein [Aporhodopirellula aestuarii]MCM2372432.1 ATP-grasp domain-containing protein [Aporhodopirellula aestuarii]